MAENLKSNKYYIHIVVIFVLFLSCVSITNAELLERDDPVFGLKTITLDTGTGLEWLDVTLGIDMSVIDILDGAGGFIAAGFRYATNSEIVTLYENAGITFTEPFGPNIPENYIPVNNLINLMGCNSIPYGCGENRTSSGLYDPFVPAPNEAYSAGVSTNVANMTGVAQTMGGVSINLVNSTTGHYLVREGQLDT